MLLLVVTQHISSFVDQLLDCLKRALDRGCRCSAKHTKSLSQSDYEDTNTGLEFLMDFKYAAMLTVLYITMLYGSGIPILYVVAAAFYFSSYWVDKFLLFRYFKRPLMMDQFLAKNTLSWFKYALVLHIIGGMLMYSNSAILPVKDTITSSEYGKEF